jgi:ABC-2 type transport system permease protein
MKTLKWLVLREFWEHKGGFVWAPLAVAAIVIFFSIAALTSRYTGSYKSSTTTTQSETAASEKRDAVSAAVATPLASSSSSNATKATATEHSYRAKRTRDLADEFLASAMTTIFVLIPLFILFAVWSLVAVFYCAGALYDERKDRSVLFWKSLPITDRITVTSKAVTVLVVSLGIVWLIGTLLVPFLMGTLWLSVLFEAPPPEFRVDWTSGMSAPLSLAALLPIYALWALPTVGWLMMVSAWARSKPLLWGLFVPLLAGGLLAWVNRAFSLGWGIDWFWQHIVLRIVGGLIPGAWFFRGERPLEELSQSMEKSVTSTGDVGAQLVNYSWSAAATPEMWIGVAAGVLMLTAAIYLRRWRDEG